MSLEKSSKIQLTKSEYATYKYGVLPTSVSLRYGIETYEELKKVVEAGEYEVQQQL